LGWGVLDLDWISAVESWNANPTNYNRERSLGPIRPGLGYRNPIHIWLYTVSLRIPTFDIGGYRSSHSSIGWDVTQGLAFFWISGLAFYKCRARNCRTLCVWLARRRLVVLLFGWGWLSESMSYLAWPWVSTTKLHLFGCMRSLCMLFLIWRGTVRPCSSSERHPRPGVWLLAGALTFWLFYYVGVGLDILEDVEVGGWTVL